MEEQTTTETKAEPRLKVGTVVRLKSGGPVMTVDEAPVVKVATNEGEVLECSWPVEGEATGGRREVAKFHPETLDVLGEPDSEIGRREEKGRHFDRMAQAGKVVVSFAPRLGAVMPGEISKNATASIVIDPKAPSFRRVEGRIVQEIKSVDGKAEAGKFAATVPFESVWQIDPLGPGGSVFFADAVPEERVRQMFIELSATRAQAVEFVNGLRHGIRLIDSNAQHGVLVRWARAASILISPPEERGSKIIQLHK